MLPLVVWLHKGARRMRRRGLVIEVSFASVAAALRTARERFQHLVEREAAGLLARREFFERGQELSHVLLGRHHYEDVVNAPMLVIDAFMVRGLERVRAQ